MDAQQKYKILNKLAYNCAEIYKYFHTPKSNDFNWKKAEEALELDKRINGEDFLLCMLEETNG
jgi:hypothetical protein